MIRLLFVIFVTLAGFAAAALWTVRGADVRDVAAEVVPESLRAAVDSADGVRRAVQAGVERLRPESATAPEPAVANAGDVGASAAAATAESVAPEPAPAAPSDAAERAPEVRELVPPAEFVRDTGGDAEFPDVAAAANADGMEDAFWAGGADAAVLPDPDESASLIRRMLAVYRRDGQLE